MNPNPNSKFKNNKIDNNMFTTILCSTIVIALAIAYALLLDDVHKKNIEKLHKPKPVDRTKIVSTNVTGTVESIHPWGRTEVVAMKEVELEYFQYCDQWVMSGDVVQPVDRKGYFMPVLKGHLDLDVKDLTQTWIEYGSYGINEDEETYKDFRMAHIKVQKGKIISIDYTHYRLLSDNSWKVIASWKARVNPETPEPVVQNTEKDNTPIIVCSHCNGTGECKTDINKLMMDASLSLFINHHLMVDKCEKCVKLKSGDGYAYCDVVNDRYQILLQEYAAAGPKIGAASCEKCMGMGTFSSKDLTTGKWITQEEYDEKHKKD